MILSRPVRLLRLALALASVAGAAPAFAAGPPPASPLVPPDHWAVDAARRLHEAGLLPGWMPAQRAVPIAAVARALAEADGVAARAGAPYAAAVRAWLARFEAEFSGLSRRAGRELGPAASGGGEERRAEGVALLGASASIGFASTTARDAAPPSPAPATIRLPAAGTDPVGAATAAATFGDHLAAGLDVRGTPSRLEARSLEVVAAAGPLQLSLGRGRVRYGPNDVGAVVASGVAPVDRVELMTTVPLRLPWVLAALGDFTLDTAVARLSEPRHPYTPLLWEFDLQWRPHARLTFGIVHGVMFGGALWEGIPASQIPLALFGIKNYRENNVLAGTIHYRLPTEALVPLTAKVEWGTDDEPYAAWKWPGLVVGLSAPMLGSLAASLGVEGAYFGKGVGPAHPPFGWYSHSQYVGGWVTGQTPLGDPLGGNGRALRAVASLDPLGARLRIRGTAFVQDRSPDNLYAPAAAGRSVGGDGEVDLRLGRGALGLRAAVERGDDGWRRGEVSAALTVFF